MNRYIANPTALRKVLVAALLALTGSLAITACGGCAAAPAGQPTRCSPSTCSQWSARADS